MICESFLGRGQIKSPAFWKLLYKGILQSGFLDFLYKGILQSKSQGFLYKGIMQSTFGSFCIGGFCSRFVGGFWYKGILQSECWEFLGSGVLLTRGKLSGDSGRSRKKEEERRKKFYPKGSNADIQNISFSHGKSFLLKEVSNLRRGQVKAFLGSRRKKLSPQKSF